MDPSMLFRGYCKVSLQDDGDRICNFRPLTMLNTDIKLLAKILADHL